MLAAPNYPVNFCAGFVGDILTSTFRIFIHFLFAIVYSCLFAISWIVNDSRLSSSLSTLWWDCNPIVKQILVPYITILPLWIRFMQCLRCVVQSGDRWPHFGNAFKYATTFVVISIGIFDVESKKKIVWIVGLTIVTLIQLSWDIFMDWGFSLHRPLLIHNRWIYMTFTVMNMFLRFSWVISLNFDQQYREVHLWECSNKKFPTIVENVQSAFERIDLVYLEICLCILELTRRSMWGILRLEYEQISRFGIPIHPNDPETSLVDVDMEILDEGTPDVRLTVFSRKFAPPLFGINWTIDRGSVVISKTIHMITGLESIRFCDMSWIPHLIEILYLSVLLLVLLVFIA